MNDVFLNSAKKQKKPNIFQVFVSVAAAAFGVQSKENRERDFKQGKFSTFVMGGLVFTVLFIMCVYLVVSAVLGSAS